ncbi:tetratricopeptide repeat protein [Pseudaminobacter sp. 19-2017]|uniref:Tetratricopeptide repeat protein n=1 Tax=Pseudaminobacter soli (ex Zhang et al. 2022) TaxID=2831468 RepID=A0A942DV10_9HYPH|nr:tetratricopeptide repeat protein [Pseudaminobacter soli]MBS3647056.1 tetratricopeptide repeat protein [Pseudaminobacter soli]
MDHPVAEVDEDGAEVLSVDQAIEMALGLIRKRELKAAAEILGDIVENVPDHADAWNYLGVVHFHLEGPDASIETLKHAAESAPRHAGIRNNLGNAYVEAGNIHAAVDAYEKAIEIDPNLADPYCNLASIMKYAGNPEFAEKLLRKAIDVNPEFGVAHQNLASILLDSGRAREAIDYFWKATVHLPDKAVPAHFLALAYWFAGLKDLAIDFVRKWADANPDDAQAQHMRASMTGENVPDRASDVYVRKLFDQFANSFDAKLDSLEYRAPEIVGLAMAAAQGVARDLVILDAGCGTGKCAKYLKPYASVLDGVDLSKGMIAKAQKMGIYDRLECGELTDFLQSRPRTYDIVASADTLCYFGRLEQFSAAAASALRPGGVLVFTVEPLDNSAEDFQLAVNGRYTHSEAYVRRCLEEAGFEVVSSPREKLRTENAEPVIGLVVTARR